MNTLSNIYYTLAKQGYQSDKNTVHSYLPVYERILDPYRGAAAVLEIGLFNGHSLRMWEQYFESADVHGVDCDVRPHGGLGDLTAMIASGAHNIHIFDAESWTEVLGRFDGVYFDVIIEDAGHHLDQQVKMYDVWKHYLAPGGIYIIEDVQDIDASRDVFRELDDTKDIEIVDLRGVKGRYDDVLVIIKDKA
jgi:hypothetical protein